ncbi:MAG TPA: CvpA family protein [Acidimicrobiales bacterium]|nr:CvpA family protein [Acidimicrobiales bacterium]
MGWVDLIIAIIVVLAGVRGFAEGAIRQVAGLAGIAGGFLLGAAVAPSLSGDITKSGWRPAIALFIVLIITVLGGIVGGLIGHVIKHVVSAIMLGMVDRIVGVVVGAGGALIMCWLVAGLLTNASWGSVASGIQNSSILAAMDHVMPPVPNIEAKVESLFHSAGVPNIFADVVTPTLPPTVKPNKLAPLVHGLSQPSNVVKVLASGGCSEVSEGTAFYVTSNEVITNAHVVAGEKRVLVNGRPAVVALYDPKYDLAVLRVSQSESPLNLLSTEPSRGTGVQVIGFPLNGTRTKASGYDDGELTGAGRGIYDETLFIKSVIDLEVNVNPGNSGSPVLVGGQVAGIVESKSISQVSTGYAIPDSVIRADVAKTPARGSVSTQTCLP